MKVVLRYALEADGGQCVTMAGTTLMLRWSVENLDTTLEVCKRYNTQNILYLISIYKILPNIYFLNVFKSTNNFQRHINFEEKPPSISDVTILNFQLFHTTNMLPKVIK